MSSNQEIFIQKLIWQKRGARHEIQYLSKKFGIQNDVRLDIEQASVIIGVLLKLPDKE